MGDMWGPRASAWKAGASFLLDPDASPTQDLLAWAAPQKGGCPGRDRGCGSGGGPVGASRPGAPSHVGLGWGRQAHPCLPSQLSPCLGACPPPPPPREGVFSPRIPYSPPTSRPAPASSRLVGLRVGRKGRLIPNPAEETVGGAGGGGEGSVSVLESSCSRLRLDQAAWRQGDGAADLRF